MTAAVRRRRVHGRDEPARHSAGGRFGNRAATGLLGNPQRDWRRRGSAGSPPAAPGRGWRGEGEVMVTRMVDTRGRGRVALAAAGLLAAATEPRAPAPGADALSASKC